jgi:hypothetical protein
MSKFSSLSQNAKKAIIYAGCVLLLLVVYLIVRLILGAVEHSRSFTFTADPLGMAEFKVDFRYDELDQDDYETMDLGFLGLENILIDEIGNSSPYQGNSSISKNYGNIQIDFVYPTGAVYKIDGSVVSLRSYYTGDDKKYLLEVDGADNFTREFNSYPELLAYLQPYLVPDGYDLSPLSIVTDGYGSPESSIQLFSDNIGYTQYGFPSNCEIEYSVHNPSNENMPESLQSIALKEFCPPNQDTFFPGLLDNVGFIDKIDFFITTDEASGSYPIIIDPKDAYAFMSDNRIIDVSEINSYLFIIDSTSRIHVTAHNNYIRFSTDWSSNDKIPQGLFSFPHAIVELTSLPGQLHYGKTDRVVDAASTLEFYNGRKIRASIYSMILDPENNPYSAPFFVKGIFDEIILNDRTLIDLSE